MVSLGLSSLIYFDVLISWQGGNLDIFDCPLRSLFRVSSA